MKKWEYRSVEEYKDGTDEDLFCSLGAIGWELVSYQESEAEEDSGYDLKYTAIFKRELLDI